MKISALTIGGFKGLAQTAHIPLAPITLLFGANSTGKSTVLQALLYLYEIIVERNFDPQYSSITGEQLWLGGFHNLVHGKDLTNTITLGATLDFRDNEGEQLNTFTTDPENWLLESNMGFSAETAPEIMSFEIELAWDEYNRCVFVSRFECSCKGLSYIKIEATAGTPSAYIHSFSPLPHWSDEVNSALQHLFTDKNNGITFIPYRHALPPIERIHLPNSPLESGEITPTEIASHLFAEAAISCATLAPLKILGGKLKNLLHIGPLRIVPGRDTILEDFPKRDRWYDGTAGWDHFAFGSDVYREQVNQCFNHMNLLNSSYRFTASIQGAPPLQQRQVQLTEANANTPLRPCDVGVGVSQVFPFIATTCLDQSGVMVSCEQPELHIHPRWQLSLADMMLTACLKDPERMFLVETHSEHLMLRLLKRVSSPDNDYQTVSPEMISVINVYKHEGNLFYQRQHITENGDFELDWPQGFFEERYGEV